MSRFFSTLGPIAGLAINSLTVTGQGTPLTPDTAFTPTKHGAFGLGAGLTPETTNANEPLFSPEQAELLAFRRFNPLLGLNAGSLTAALDGYLTGYLRPAAILWDRLAKQQKTIRNVKAKREEAVALRTMVVEALDDSPAAADQKAVLDHFYRNARAGHALMRNVSGGWSKIVMQMMEAKSFGSAAHHLIWRPDSAVPLTLPSGKSVPSLTCKFEYVPMEFFESRTGELRFLGMTQGFAGIALDPTAWLVTYEESPLMFAASILAYYDKLAHADLVNFSEKFGTPGLVVHTTAQRGTPEGLAAANLTRTLGSNYRGTQYGAAENKVEIVWPSGGTSGSELPMHTIIEDVKRDLASLFLGADLSTQSRAQQSVGASVQQDGEENRERADCVWISETLQAGIDPIVLRWYFGDAPVLAKVTIDAPKNEDRKVLGDLVTSVVGMGAQVPMAPVLKRLNVPMAKEGEKDVFTAPAAPAATIPAESEETKLAANARQDAAYARLRAATARALATNSDAAFLRAAQGVYQLLATNFDPDEMRDERGEWTKGGAVSKSKPMPHEDAAAHDRADASKSSSQGATFKLPAYFDAPEKVDGGYRVGNRHWKAFVPAASEAEMLGKVQKWANFTEKNGAIGLQEFLNRPAPGVPKTWKPTGEKTKSGRTIYRAPLKELGSETVSYSIPVALDKLDPVIIGDHGDVVDGWHRIAMARERGDKTVRAIYASEADFDVADKFGGLNGHGTPSEEAWISWMQEGGKTP